MTVSDASGLVSAPVAGTDQIDCDWFDKASDREQEFALKWAQLYPEIDLHTEYQYHPDRKFRLDFVHLESKTGIEIQGGTHMGKSGHNTGAGLKRDAEKAQYAASIGWVVLPVTSDTIKDDEVIHRIAETIKLRNSND